VLTAAIQAAAAMKAHLVTETASDTAPVNAELLYRSFKNPLKIRIFRILRIHHGIRNFTQVQLGEESNLLSSPS
jgi:glucose-6-phosphate isomerase